MKAHTGGSHTQFCEAQGVGRAISKELSYNLPKRSIPSNISYFYLWNNFLDEYGTGFHFPLPLFFFQTFSNIRLGCRSISTLTNQFRTAYSSSLSSASNTYFTIILIFGAARTNLKSYKRVMMPARYTVWLLQIFFISWRTPYTSAWR